MIDIKSQNNKILKERWPVLWQAIMNACDKLEITFVDDEKQPTIIVNGIHLSSCFDRQKEAELQAGLIPEYADEAWVYGCGLGDLPRALLQRKTLQSLNVVLLNKMAFRESLAYFIHFDWLGDPRVNLYLAEEQDRLKVPLCSAAACLRIAEFTAERIRDQVVLELATPYINQRIRNNETFKQQINANRNFVDIDAPVSELFESKPEATFYVVGAGPSLSDSFEYLKNRPENVIVISVDAALKPLLGNGILPDYVVSIDPMRDSVIAFLDIELEKMKSISLVYFPIVHRDALRLWKGKRFVACSSSPLYKEVVSIDENNQLFSAGSVIHPAIDLAVKMGAEQVEFFGADFSYPKDRTHASGVLFGCNIDTTRVLAWVRNGKGEQVPSAPNLVGYLRELERYIADHHAVRFLNSSYIGAKIQGTDYFET